MSGDDLLLPERVEKQVRHFESLPESFAAIFSNAQYINHKEQIIRHHFAINDQGYTQSEIPKGDIFKEVLKKYFICTPTIMFRKTSILESGGYDENLSYEDFDIQLRLSRQFLIDYQDEILTIKRLHPYSQSLSIINRNNALLPSTYIVCRKATLLCKDDSEFKALDSRITSFIRKSYYSDHFELAINFSKLYSNTKRKSLLTRIILILCKQKTSINCLYTRYIKTKHMTNLY